MRQNSKFLPQELQSKEWIKRADDDELNARSILKHRDGAPNGVCFLSHQSVEKYLKAFLVLKENRYPRVHPLDKLTELCTIIDPSFVKIKDQAIFLNGFYIPTRYPGEYPEFSWRDAEEAYQAAITIKEFVLRKLSG